MGATIYIRFSSKRQEKGASRERQLQDCTAYCARKGWPVDRVVEDLGKSAWTGANLSAGQLGRWADSYRAGEIGRDTILVCEKLDRLSRQEPRTTQRWMEDLCAAGLRIATVAGDRVYDDQSLRGDLLNVFEILMRAKLARDESDQKSERVTDAKIRAFAAAKATGKVITSKCPGWLAVKADRSGFDVVEERAEIVRLIYGMAAAGKGAGWIAGELNDRGVQAWGTWRKKGTTPTWELTMVKLILRQPACEGDYVPGFSNSSPAKRTKLGERLTGYYPRIVDAALVARARAAMDGRRVGCGGRHTRGVANMFAGVVVCGECGNRVHLKTAGEGRDARYYYCTHAARRRGCGQRGQFRYEPFQTTALDQLLTIALDDRYFRRGGDQLHTLVVAQAQAEKDLAVAREHVTRYARAYAATDSAAVLTELQDATRQEKTLQRACDEAGQALQAARGAVAPDEHLRRVVEVREALDHDDAETRQAARLRVREAISALGVRIRCVENDLDGRHFVLTLPDASLVVRIGVDGRVLAKLDMIAHVDLAVEPVYSAKPSKRARQEHLRTMAERAAAWGREAEPAG